MKELQRLLNKVGYALTIDGSFGPTTEKAVRSFQRAYNLALDGYYGPGTQQALAEAVEREDNKPEE